MLAADQILALDRATRSRAGTLAELLAVGGPYAELYRRHFLTQEPARAGVS